MLFVILKGILIFFDLKGRILGRYFWIVDNGRFFSIFCDFMLICLIDWRNKDFIGN